MEYYLGYAIGLSPAILGAWVNFKTGSNVLGLLTFVLGYGGLFYIVTYL